MAGSRAEAHSRRRSTQAPLGTKRRSRLYFRTADFFDGVDFLPRAPCGRLRASLTALPAWNRTALLAAIFIVCPLRGLRPSRAGRAATLKVPRPETRTASPATRESRMAFTTAFTARPAALWFSSVAWATFSISSDWFISDLQLQCYETPTPFGRQSKPYAVGQFRALLREFAALPLMPPTSTSRVSSPSTISAPRKIVCNGG